MSNVNTQDFIRRHNAFEEMETSVGRAVHALFGGRHLLSELSATAAHYEGLVDTVERAGWDVEQLCQLRSASGSAARSLMNGLADSCPDMSAGEQRSFLAPFRAALWKVASMSTTEREDFRAEYRRFTELREQAVASFATGEVA